MIPPSPASPRPRTFWQRRLLDPVVAQLTQGITPEKLALSLALGVVMGLFPVIGTTTLLCFLVALWFRLNQPIVQIINQLLWPVHLALIVPCIRLGEWLTGSLPQSLDLVAMNHDFWASPRAFLHHFGHTVGNAILGWTVASPFVGLVLYFTALPLLRRVAALQLSRRSSIA